MSQYGYPTSDPLFDQETGYSQKFSNKPLILKDLFNWNGSILINGKQISRGLYDFNFQILGIDLKTLPSTSHQTQDSYTKSHPAPMTKPRDGAAFINLADVIPQQDSYYTKNGKEYYVSSPIKWPLDYEYNPQAPRRKVHDFCTWSTDLWGGMPPQSLIMADFRGPCAIHDQCFVKYTDRENRLSICNPQFKDKMIANCRGVYASPTVTQSCIAESYARHALVQTGEYLTNW